ncbi:MAG: hypothetical protein FWF04_05745, partial [Clostridiales bacterium]|nr:hypothetical protein [Clostridiales bacterium]
EAGTGTGKSLAYLLPAALYALNSGQRVAVSTQTINLQEQLLQKDIPLLEKLLQHTVRAVVLKGRANYLCWRMYRSQLRHPGENMRYFLMRLASWLPHSNGGDSGELNLTSHDKWRWQRVCASSENCDAACPYFKSGCFVNRARRETEKADIFILNHSLLIANAAMESGFLPELPNLIIDEAHHLERAAEDQLTGQVDFYTLLRLLGRLRRRERGKSGGLLESLIRQAMPLAETETKKQAINSRLAALDEVIEQAVRQAEQFFGLLQQHFMADAFTDGYFPARLRLLPQHRRALSWSAIDNLGQGLAAMLSELSRSCVLFSELLQNLAGESSAELNGREELISVAALCNGFAATLADIMAGSDDMGPENMVCWLEFTDKDKLPSLNAAPIELGEILKERLFSHTESLVFTSATITSADSFKYFKKRLGLDLLDMPPDELVVASPFFYRDQALLGICTSLPDWSKSGELAAQEALAGALLQLLSASRGRALVLFTSHIQLKAVYGLLREPLREQGVTVLAHGISGDPARLLRRLHREPNCCILGANSFWEGVDVIGSALSLVVVVRLPFWPPNTPTIAARLERIEAEGGSSFYEYSLPQAIIRFKQGFGRLIRSTEDTGVFIVLDRRVNEKSYGRFFRKSLPEMKQVLGSAAELAQHITIWLR